MLTNHARLIVVSAALLLASAAVQAQLVPVGTEYVPPAGGTLVLDEAYGSGEGRDGQGSWLSDNSAITINEDHIVIDSVYGSQSAYLELPFAINTAHTIDIGIVGWNTPSADGAWAGTWQFTSYPGWGSGLKYKYIFRNNDGGSVYGLRARTGNPVTHISVPENTLTVIRKSLGAGQMLVAGTNPTVTPADDDWNGGTGAPRWTIFSETSGSNAQFKVAWIKMYTGVSEAQPALSEKSLEDLPVPADGRYQPPANATLVIEERYGSDFDGIGSWVASGSDAANAITELGDGVRLSVAAGTRLVYLDLGSLSLRNVESVVDIGIKSWSTTNSPAQYAGVIRLNDGYGSGLRNEWIARSAAGTYNGTLAGRNAPSSWIGLPQAQLTVLRLTGKFNSAAAYRDYWPETATTGYDWNGGAGVNKLQIHSEGTGASSTWDIAWVRVYVVQDDPAQYEPPLRAAYCGGPGTEFKPGDISGPDGVPDCYVDLYDFAKLAQQWDDCTDPANPDCYVDPADLYSYEYEDLPLDGGGAVQCVAGSPHNSNLVLAGVDVAGIFRSTDAGQTWNMVNTGLLHKYAYAIADVAFSPADADLAFAATGTTWGTGSTTGAFYYSQDAGQTWQHASSGVSFGGHFGLRQYGSLLVPHPDDPCTIFAGTATQGVMMSEDLGHTWQSRSPTNIGAVMVLVSPTGDPNNLLAGSISHEVSGAGLPGVWKSDNGGQAWSHVYGGGNIYDIAVAANGEIIAVSDNNVLRSVDGGASWSSFTAGLPTDGQRTYRWNCVGADPTNPGRFIIAAIVEPSRFHYPKIFARNPGESAWYAIDADVAAIYTPFGTPGVDGWQGFTNWLAATPSAIKYHPGTNRAYLPDWYTVNVSNDSGETWAARNAGLRTTVPYFALWDALDPTYLYLGVVDVGIHEGIVTEEPISVRSLRNTFPGSDGSLAQFSYNNDVITLACMDGKNYYRRVNHGSWSQVYTYNNACGGDSFSRSFSRFAVKDGSATVFATLPNGMILRSTNAGQSWSCYSDSLLTNAAQAAGQVSTITYKPGQDRWHVSVDGVDYFAAAPGSWTATETADYVFYEGSASRAYRVIAGLMGRFTVQRTTDAGDNWQSVFTVPAYSGPGDTATVVSTSSPNIVYAYWNRIGARTGIAVSFNGGDEWHTLPTPPGYQIMGLHPDPLSPDRFILRSHGIGFWLGAIQ